MTRGVPGELLSAVTSIAVTVRYFAAAAAAAGVNEEITHVAEPASVESVLRSCIERHGAALAGVLQRCSFLLDGVAVHHRSTPIAAGQAIDVLPPFAGG